MFKKLILVAALISSSSVFAKEWNSYYEMHTEDSACSMLRYDRNLYNKLYKDQKFDCATFAERKAAFEAKKLADMKTRVFEEHMKKAAEHRVIRAKCNDRVKVGMTEKDLQKNCAELLGWNATADYGHTKFTHYELPISGRVIVRDGIVTMILNK